MTDTTLLLESFRRNGRVNAHLLDDLTDADLALSDGRGGMTVARLLSHMGVSRGGWLAEMSPEHVASTVAITGTTPIWNWHADDLAAIRALLEAGDEAAIQAVQAHAASGEPFADPHGVGTFPSNPALFLLYMIVHDANHRGQIVALLRQAGASKERLDHLEDGWNLWRA
ncbi:putative damage-inducible protein DinB [Deinococcus metalli]|uniref:Damage-inducible protein DinB n=1 Tax=Deinococcus metalli TaxID=1141878 RepID=A0A7W8KD33_9DEIO|nr:DinB family protein [Deinococcus metalli]MBB5375985.1 putative damage-inducible protein DinB [Deinococcus metalli]GHF41673.1 damage-inducible protein DinB [Deinococcus metalli]